MLAPAKIESAKKVDDIEDAINSCLSDVGSDINDVVDVIRKAIVNDDDAGFVARCVFNINLTPLLCTKIFEIFSHMYYICNIYLEKAVTALGRVMLSSRRRNVTSRCGQVNLPVSGVRWI